MRFVVGEASPAEVHALAALSDHDDAWMVGCPARWGRGSPPMETDAGNLGYPILFFANCRGNLAREFCAQFGDRV